jgi:hypothetical protein
MHPVGGNYEYLTSPYIVPAGYILEAETRLFAYLGTFENLTCEGDPESGWLDNQGVTISEARPPLAFQRGIPASTCAASASS